MLEKQETHVFFGGLTNAEAAESIGVTERSMERQWAFAKGLVATERGLRLRSTIGEARLEALN